ncbi:hypothetical protein ADUPG1_008308 [Aduncisulcus paluster]|uniref:Uncharacterized protein n=1 Tax=Aduncisulcus paluster TaxID=2918883 RepID=A0ABQ5KST5_9EUKA|nr:hypothetical protein ADUPG1_008308 [Aduncisulcus paluster]
MTVVKCSNRKPGLPKRKHVDNILMFLRGEYEGVNPADVALALINRLSKTSEWLVALKCVLVVDEVATSPKFCKVLLHGHEITGSLTSCFNLQSLPRSCDSFEESNTLHIVRNFSRFVEISLSEIVRWNVSPYLIDTSSMDFSPSEVADLLRSTNNIINAAMRAATLQKPYISHDSLLEAADICVSRLITHDIFMLSIVKHILSFPQISHVMKRRARKVTPHPPIEPSTGAIDDSVPSSYSATVDTATPKEEKGDDFTELMDFFDAPSSTAPSAPVKATSSFPKPHDSPREVTTRPRTDSTLSTSSHDSPVLLSAATARRYTDIMTYLESYAANIEDRLGERDRSVDFGGFKGQRGWTEGEVRAMKGLLKIIKNCVEILKELCE